MKEVALLYSDDKLSTLNFNENANNQKLFETIKCTELIVNKTEESGILLNGRKFNHLLYFYKEIEVIISANEIINNEIFDFLQNFWVGKFKYISLYKNSSWSDYMQVMTDTGKLPVTYIDEVRILPEVMLNLSLVNPL